MTLEPSEIREVKLSRGVFGYDRAAVHHVLQDVAETYEVVWRERAQLLERAAALEAVVARHTELEGLLRSTMIAAQTVAADLRASAHREAKLIVREANAEAQHVLKDARRKRRELMSSGSSVRMLLQKSVGATEPDEDAGRPAWRSEDPPAATSIGGIEGRQ